MMAMIYDIFFNPWKQWVAKIDLLLLALWAVSSYQWGLPVMVALVYLQLVMLVMVVFHVVVAGLVPACGFWYHHGVD